MLVLLVEKSGNDERHLREPARFQIAPVIASGGRDPGVVGPSLEKVESAVRALLPHVVDLPADGSFLEEVQDHRIAERPAAWAITRGSVGRDSARRAGDGVEAGGVGRAPHRAGGNYAQGRK